MQNEFDSLPIEVDSAKGGVLYTEFGRKIPAPASWWKDEPESDIPESVREARPSDLNLMVRAMSERWPITPEKRDEMIQAAQEVMRSAKSARTKLAAMKVLLMADALNVRTEDSGGNHLHLHGQAPVDNTKEVAKKLMMDPKYISFLRQLDSEPKVCKDSEEVDFEQVQQEFERDGDLPVLEGMPVERRDEADSVQERQEGEQGTA